MSLNPNIYAVKDHRTFLRAMVEHKREGDAKFSLAYFSRKIRLSESYLKLVLLKKRELNLDAAALLAKTLGLHALEKSYFLTLVLRDQARTPVLRGHLNSSLFWASV